MATTFGHEKEEEKKQMELIISEHLASCQDIDSFLEATLKKAYFELEKDQLDEENFNYCPNELKEEKELVLDLFAKEEEEMKMEEEIEGDCSYIISVKERELEELLADMDEIPPNLYEYRLREVETELLDIEIQRMKKEDVGQKEEATLRKCEELVAELEEKASKQMKQAISDVKERKDTKHNIRVIRNELEGFDIHDFRRLLKKGREDKSKIAGKGALVVIGLSKSGKTTTITSALGFKMQATTVLGLRTIQPVEKLTGEYARLINSPELKSITRNPAYFKIPVQFLEEV